MSFYCPPKYVVPVRNSNKELMELTGELDDKKAQITLCEFLRRNLYVTVELLSDIQLAPYQEITLKSWFLRNFNLCVWGRGGSKSYMAAVFCFLYPIFNPGTRIIIAGPTFRTARHIFTELEKIVESPRSIIISQAFGAKAKRNDLFEWKMSHPTGQVSTIQAIPLSGEKVRGFRADVLIVDEFLLMPQDIIEAVLTPFLTVPIDVKKRIKTKTIETQLIKEGRLKPEDRTVFDNQTRVIFLSSASYTFEYLYKVYCDWLAIITNDDEKEENFGVKYCVSQLSYKAIPEEMLSQQIIETAKNGGSSHSNFQREYEAAFVDDSEGYYSAKKMKLVTIPDNEEPTIRLAGQSDAKYILAIDPSFSNSPTSDFFAMAVMELNEVDETATLVHSYAVAGGDLKNHILYLHYLMRKFNIELIVIDNAGFQFLDSANESEIFKQSGIPISFFDFDSDLIGRDYEDMLRQAKQKYSKTKIGGRIAFKQIFTSQFIGDANTHLQTCIDHKKIWFASRLNPNESALCNQIGVHFDAQDLEAMKYGVKEDCRFSEKPAILQEHVDAQDRMMEDVKKQCALIEVKITAKGTQSFELPLHLKRSTSVDRARKDNYTALLLGAWGTKCYFDLKRTPKEMETGMFIPFAVKTV